MNTTQNASQGKVAFIYVLDGSCSFAEHWPLVFQTTFIPLITELAHLSPGIGLAKSLQELLTSSALVSVITYGAADTRPHPLLNKQFFVPLNIFTRQMKNEQELGIGTSWNGGRHGMATLEGLIAAIEQYDLLMSSGIKILACHVLHAASEPPGKAIRPLWNRLAALDDVSWDDLPNEFQKRNMSFTSVLTSDSAMLENLHQKMGKRSVNPRLVLQPKYTILSSGMQQSSTAITASPKLSETPVKSSTASSTTAPSTPTRQPVAASDQSLPPTLQSNRLREFWTSFKKLEEDIKKIIAALQTMRDKPNPQMQKLLQEKFQTYEKLRLVINTAKTREVLVRAGLVPAATPIENPFVNTVRQQASAIQRTESSSSVQAAQSAEVGATSSTSDNSSTRWTGTFKWQGNMNNTIQDVVMNVSARKIQNNGRYGLWPSAISLTPNKHLTMQAITNFVKQPLVGTAAISPEGATTETRAVAQEHYNNFRVLLQHKGAVSAQMFKLLRAASLTTEQSAVASLNSDSEGKGYQLVIFPYPHKKGDPSSVQLLGAVIPKDLLHRDMSAPGPSAEQMAHQQMLLARMAHQRQVQAQAHPTLNTQANFDPDQLPGAANNIAAGLVVPPNAQIQHRRTPSGGGGFPLNMPTDAMRSFLRRTPQGENHPS